MSERQDVVIVLALDFFLSPLPIKRRFYQLKHKKIGHTWFVPNNIGLGSRDH